MAKKIFLSPSNQNNNKYAYGNTTEDVQCGKIAKALEVALKRCGFEVKLEQYLTAEQRCRDSNAWGADMHIPIHTNAYNGKVGGTRLFYYSAGKTCAQYISEYLFPLSPGTSDNISQNTTWVESKNPNGTVVYIEAEFHDVPAYAKWIIEHTTDIAEAICKGICKWYSVKYVAPTQSTTPPVQTPSTPSTPAASDKVSVRSVTNGSVGNDVKTLQAALKGLGYYTGVVDGEAGNLTKQAIIKLQKARGLTADGVCGVKTWAELLRK